MRTILEPRKCKIEALRIGQLTEMPTERPRMLRQTLKKTSDQHSSQDCLAINVSEESVRLGKRNFRGNKSGLPSKLQVKKSREPVTRTMD